MLCSRYPLTRSIATLRSLTKPQYIFFQAEKLRDQRSRSMTTANGHTIDHGQNGHHQEISAWHVPGNGPSQFDFRSDTMTTPTLSMLHAIQNTTLLDDVFLEDPTTNSLESHIVTLTGKEAALLVMSGTMGNQISMRTHLHTPPYSVVCDHRSHIVKYEAGGVSLVSGAMTIPIVPSNGHHLTLEDIESQACISTDIHACPTRVISLENTLNGTIFPQSEILRISQFAKSHNILLHLDGARIWEVAASTNTALSQLLQPFDSASLCFSKGLGAPIGSIIVGSKSFISRARHFRKMLGGGTRQAGVISAPARTAVDETFGLDPFGQSGKLKTSHVRAQQIAQRWEAKGGKLTYPVETNMVWLDLKSLGLSDSDFIEVAKKHGLQAFSGRLVVHYQISDEGVQRLEKVMDEVLATAKKGIKRKTDGGREDLYGSASAKKEKMSNGA